MCSFEVGAVVLIGTAPARPGRAHKAERATVRTTLTPGAVPARPVLSRWQTGWEFSASTFHGRAPETFATSRDADDRLAEQQTEIKKGGWRDPDAGAVNFRDYALQWVEERGLAATTDELYRRLPRLHLLPVFEEYDLDEITPPRVRTWRAERLRETGATTVAKAYRLLKAIMETAADDELRAGAGGCSSTSRPTVPPGPRSKRPCGGTTSTSPTSPTSSTTASGCAPPSLS